MLKINSIKNIIPNNLKGDLKRFVPQKIVNLLKTGEIQIVSYPKCGRSWFKLIICDLVYKHYNITSKIDDVSTELLYKLDKKVPKIIFTHDDDPMYKTIEELNHDKSNYQYTSVVFLVRDPRDVIVSWFFEYKYRVSEKSKKEDMSYNSISEFIRNRRGGIESLIGFYNLWVDKKDVPKKFMILRYEDLVNSGMDFIRKFLGFSRLDFIDNSSINYAIGNNTFSKVQKREQKGEIINGKEKVLEFGATDNNNKETLKARKGKVGGYTEYLSTKDIEFLDQIIQEKLNPIFRY